MEPAFIPYSLGACYGLLEQTVGDLPHANTTYEEGIAIIRMSMMRSFGLDHYDEAMGVVYTTLDDETWDWNQDEMNSHWRSWREHRNVSNYPIRVLPCPFDILHIEKAHIVADGSEGQVGHEQNDPATAWD